MQLNEQPEDEPSKRNGVHSGNGSSNGEPLDEYGDPVSSARD